MKVSQYKVELYKKVVGSDNVWETTPVNITDIIEANIKDGIKVSADSFSIALKNSEVDFQEYKYLIATTGTGDQISIDIDDRMQIFAWYGFDEPASHSAKFLFDGFIKEIGYQTSANGQRYYNISGVNTSEILLKVLLPARYQQTDANNNSPLIIQSFLNIINDPSDPYNPRNVTWHPSNPSTKVDGSAFKELNYIQKFKPIYTMIEELSEEDFTGDEDYPYYHYIKTEEVGSDIVNYLYWLPRENTSSGTITEGEEIFACKIQRGIWDTVNALIINCGRDANGAGMHTYTYDVESYGKVGGRWKYIAFEDIGNNLLQNEKTFNPSSFTDDSNFPTSFPYTTYFISSDTYTGSPAVTEGNPVICANASEFNTAIRREAKFLGRQRGDNIIKKQGRSRFKAQIEMDFGTIDYSIGQVVDLIVPSYGWTSDNPRKLRVQEITHTIGMDGWQTEIELEEDWQIATITATEEQIT